MIQEGLDNAKDEDEKAGYQQQLGGRRRLLETGLWKNSTGIFPKTR